MAIQGANLQLAGRFHSKYDDDYRQVYLISNGRGTAYGHHGEILQGAFESDVGIHRGLVTLPCSSMKSVAAFVPDESTEISVFPETAVKALAAARLFVSRRCDDKIGGSIKIDSNIPQGFGFGSSTSDIIATIRALSDATSQQISHEEIAQIAVEAEIASDATMFDSQAVLFAQREGRVIEYYGRSLPPLHILSVNTAPDVPVDTVALNPARYTSAEIEAFRPLRAMVKRAVLDQDPSLLGRVATASSLICQRHLKHRNFQQVRTVGERSHALGTQVSHSGTLVGLLFDASKAISFQYAVQARAELASLGISATIYSAI